MKKFNYKLTIVLVSFFISMILCACSNLSEYCLFFGFIMLGVTSGLFAVIKLGDLNKRVQEIAPELQEATPEDQKHVYKIVNKERRKLIVGFGGLSVFMIIMAFVLLFA